MERFLRSRGESVKKAAKHLRTVLSWRETVGAGTLISFHSSRSRTTFAESSPCRTLYSFSEICGGWAVKQKEATSVSINASLRCYALCSSRGLFLQPIPTAQCILVKLLCRRAEFIALPICFIHSSTVPATVHSLVLLCWNDLFVRFVELLTGPAFLRAKQITSWPTSSPPSSPTAWPSSPATTTTAAQLWYVRPFRGHADLAKCLTGVLQRNC